MKVQSGRRIWRMPSVVWTAACIACAVAGASALGASTDEQAARRQIEGYFAQMRRAIERNDLSLGLKLMQRYRTPDFTMKIWNGKTRTRAEIEAVYKKAIANQKAAAAQAAKAQAAKAQAAKAQAAKAQAAKAQAAKAQHAQQDSASKGAGQAKGSSPATARTPGPRMGNAQVNVTIDQFVISGNKAIVTATNRYARPTTDTFGFPHHVSQSGTERQVWVKTPQGWKEKSAEQLSFETTTDGRVVRHQRLGHRSGG